MQYDTIILELLSRIKKLEDDVEQLKQSQSELSEAHLQAAGVHSSEEYRSTASSSGSYMKTTEEMIEICYEYGKKFFEGENVKELANKISGETGMNRNSATIYIYAVSCMLKGTVFKRAINAKAMQLYFDKIFSEYGSEGLKKAIQAARLHIIYRKGYGQTVDSIEELCDKNENKLR